MGALCEHPAEFIAGILGDNLIVNKITIFIPGIGEYNVVIREVKIMTTEFTAIIKNDGDWWIGWIEEIPGANAQEKTREELIISLREATKDILELNRLAAIESAEEEFEEILLAI